MEKGSVDKTQLERPYTSFLFKALLGIYESWDEGEVVLALDRACRLVVFLPNDIKEVLWVEKEKIHKDMNNARKPRSQGFYSSLLEGTTNQERMAMYHLEPFVDKMVRLLDEKGWLERGALKPRYPSARKLSVETIEP